MRRSPYHYSHHHRAGRRHFGPALVVLGMMFLGVGVLVASLVLAGLVLAGIAAVAVVSTRRWNRRLAWQHHRTMTTAPPQASVPQHTLRHQPTAPQPSGHPPPELQPSRSQPTQDWTAVRTRFALLRSEYGQFECDPLAVLRLPALTDVTVPSTGRFVDAFAEAQALDTDTEPSPAHRARFAAAVEQAWRAWHAARDAAERIRLSGIPAQERITVQRAIKLLTMARDSDHDAERAAAYSRARAELAKLDRSGTVRLPPAAAAALATAARGQLPPAPTAP